MASSPRDAEPYRANAGPQKATPAEVPAPEDEGDESDEYDSGVGEDEDGEGDDDDDYNGAEERGGTGLTHLLIGGVPAGNGADQEDEDEDEDEDDTGYVPNGGKEPADEEVDGYARGPTPDPGPATGEKRSREAGGSADVSEPTVEVRNTKRAKA